MAYMLAKSGQQLEYALSLIEKAIKIDPHSPQFLDTKGLILQKQKKYGAAVKTFETA